MHIISDPSEDVSTTGKPSGGYEWWYFDAVDDVTGYSFVVIFYEGNPFSRRYAQCRRKDRGDRECLPDAFPAVSISVYKDSTPVFYSFTEYPQEEALFGSDVPNLKIGHHSLVGEYDEERLVYRIHLEEELPSGEAIRADIRFGGRPMNPDIIHSGQTNKNIGHSWNLLQPIALVHATLNFSEGRRIEFEGIGYHDHNTGLEPMEREFRDWYWGRHHFPGTTLVYYVMNTYEGAQHRGWLISNELDRLEQDFEKVELDDYGNSVFGLNSARKLRFAGSGYEVTVQHSQLLDNGPFYQRFLSEAFLRKDDGTLYKSTGLSEYIRPQRIHWALFRPLVDMRIHYKEEGPHWVQKSKRLSRWTW